MPPSAELASPVSAAEASTGQWRSSTFRSFPTRKRPKSAGNVGFRFSSADGRLRLLGNYRLSWDSIDVGGVALDDYQVLDLALSYSPSDKLEVYGRVENGFDEDYQEVLGYNTAGRSAYAGLRLRF